MSPSSGSLFEVSILTYIYSVFVAGQVLKRLIATFPDKVRGQEALSGKKAALLYDVLDSYPDIYKVVPDKKVRSRMNICFRVAKVRSILSSFYGVFVN